MIILFGAAGSGKSLQGQRLAENHGWEWLSVGQLLRNRHDPELEAIMLKGELVPDDLVVRMMHEAAEEALAAGKPNVVLDGYPRDEWQAKWIVDNGDVEKIQGAIILRVSHDELWRRLEERGREDDTRESIEKRWGLFELILMVGWFVRFVDDDEAQVAHGSEECRAWADDDLRFSAI